MNDPYANDAAPPADGAAQAANDAASIAAAFVTALAEPAAEPVNLPWADVGAEKLQMLRLAPLAADRATGSRPLRFVQVGRAERHGGKVSLLRLDIQLPGQRVHKEQNHLDVWVNHGRREVRTEPKEGLVVEPPNRGLGRFLLAQAILWVQKSWPDYQINSTSLSGKEGLSEDTRMRRDHALRSLGLEVEYTDPLLTKAHYKAAVASSLTATWNLEKVQVVEMLDAANMLQQADHNLQELENKLRRSEEIVARHKRDEVGLRFTISCLIAFSVFQAVLLIWMASRH